MASPTVGLAAAPLPPPPEWVNLPREITAMILQKLGSIELLVTARKVCTTWRNICKDPAMWRVINMNANDPPYYAMKLCRQAVDLSQGEVIDIEIVADDELIAYIAHRSPKVRCLRLIGWYEYFCKSISQAVKNFPLLEEIHFIYRSITVESMQLIRDIDSSCPLLTTLTLSAHPDKYPQIGFQESRNVNSESNNLAFVVSSMHKLHHLGLFGSNMTNEGLAAILDGCPQLESLDLRRCWYLHLYCCEVGERCRQQIKHLRLPNHDFTED